MMDKEQFDAILLEGLEGEDRERMIDSKLYLSLWLQCFTWDELDFEFALIDDDFNIFFWNLCRRHHLN